ncbi:MAG: XdhC family protein [Pseudomonadota bacterium]
MATEHDRIPEIALDWAKGGRDVALATVVETWGSAPRPVGSQLVIDGDARMMGSVSGGCVEGAVVAEALDALEDGQPRVLTYGVSDDDAFAVGLACGGTIRILVEPVARGQGPDLPLLEALVSAREMGRPTAYVVGVGLEEAQHWPRLLMDHAAGTPLGDAVRTALTSDKAGFTEIDGESWFIGVHNPALKLVIVGGVHIAQPLSVMATEAGYAVTIVDPREAFASPERFPGQTIVNDWPDAALEGLDLDSRTAVVTLTHDPKLDDPAIRTALAADVFYLGCLGSTRTHGKRVSRLEEAGFSPGQIARIHGPIGADIGAKSPAEIAVSILAQMTERLRRIESRPGG